MPPPRQFSTEPVIIKPKQQNQTIGKRPMNSKIPFPGANVEQHWTGDRSFGPINSPQQEEDVDIDSLQGNFEAELINKEDIEEFVSLNINKIDNCKTEDDINEVKSYFFNYFSYVSDLCEEPLDLYINKVLKAINNKKESLSKVKAETKIYFPEKYNVFYDGHLVFSSESQKEVLISVQKMVVNDDLDFDKIKVVKVIELNYGVYFEDGN